MQPVERGVHGEDMYSCGQPVAKPSIRAALSAIVTASTAPRASD
ncbi:MAG: hypothetical protein R3C14_21225 [Caldilineaceae bacterium]